METGRKDIICPLPGGMRRKRAAELFGAGAGLRRLSDREKTLLIDRLRPAYSPGSMTCLPGLRVRAAGAFTASEGGYGYRRVKAMLRTRVSEKVLRSPMP